MAVYDKTVLSRRVKKILKLRDMSQQELAKKAGMSPQQLGKCINPDDTISEFRASQLMAVAAALETSIEWITGAGPDDPEQAAAGMRDTSKGPSLRQIAEFFYDLTRINPGIAFGTVQRKEIRLYNDEYDSRTQDGVFEYTAAVYFPEYFQDDGRPDYAIRMEQAGGNHIPRAGQINRFLETLSRLTQLYEQGNLSPEELDTLMLNRIAQLPDDPIEQIRPVAVQDPAGPGAGK